MSTNKLGQVIVTKSDLTLVKRQGFLRQYQRNLGGIVLFFKHDFI